ncbi:MAG: tryptophan-rich sensory protein [Bacteroidetes bacterium CHB5]|nr:tryptophan-rich sensory protein [Bacteroidetes bacterium CHB5]
MKTQLPYRLAQLSTRLTLTRSAEVALLSLAIGFLIWSTLAWFRVAQGIQIPVVIVSTLAIGWRLAKSKNLFESNAHYLVSYLNAHYPVLEESADLMLMEPSALSLLQQVQLGRVQLRFDQLYPQVKLPAAWRTTGLISGACVLVSVLLMAFNPSSDVQSREMKETIAALNAAVEEVKLESMVVTITPPAYMSQPPFIAKELHLVVPEGSVVTWKISLNEPAPAVLIFSGRDTVTLAATEKEKIHTHKVNESGFYQLTWKDKEKWIRSDYFKIEIIKDQPPKLDITNLEQFTKFEFTNPLKVDVRASLQDDFGLADAAVIATVSKGSGESVKFREERLKFDSPARISGKQVQASVVLDLIKLGLEPGDELYFYVEASDIKMPTPNYARTETYFIAIQDTTQYNVVEDEGLGVDLMPEYFRSQRQIIIDTEKLLREKKKITTQQFKSTSNELGYDQKVLRLRYGQFMGEEFEDQIGGVTLSAADLDKDETTEETLQRLSHQHDTENEHNLVEEKKATTDTHDHEHEGNEKDPLAAFAHQHDDGETATFFIESMRTKLKAALTVMWDAELYLRLYEPEKSLPYQYTALKLLKEISNDSRIYVHRTGFDPPPLKEEKRLSGDLAEVRSYTGTSLPPDKQDYPAIRQAQQVLELWMLDRKPFTDQDKTILTIAGNELAAAALEHPEKYLHGLSIVKNLTEDNLPETERPARVAALRTIFMQLAEGQETPSEKKQAVHPLDQQFLKSLND